MSRAPIDTKTGTPLETAWACLRRARLTESGIEFIDALQGALQASERCYGTDAALVVERVAALQKERGPRLVPEQLAYPRLSLAYLDEQAADAAETA